MTINAVIAIELNRWIQQRIFEIIEFYIYVSVRYGYIRMKLVVYFQQSEKSPSSIFIRLSIRFVGSIMEMFVTKSEVVKYRIFLIRFLMTE